MIKYAIVGNIASGKTAVEKILKKYGCSVADADAISHEITEKNTAQIQAAFQGYDITENGKISREKLGKLVFSNPKMKKKLENILHPLIKEKIKDFFNANTTEDAVFVAVPLLFEAKMENLFDKIIFVYTDDRIRLERLIARNGYSKEYALRRMNCQQSQDEKISKCDIVIYNNSTLKKLENEVKNVLL